MKTINIKGKNYVMVNERIKAFRANFKGYSLLSEVVEMTDTSCTIKATILNDKREPVATGLAREVVGKTPINKFAFVENAETSAWGRALGNFGIGIDDAICTAEELVYKTEHDKGPQAPDAKTEPKVFGEAEKKQIACAKTEQELKDICNILIKVFPKKQIAVCYNKRLAELKDAEKKETEVSYAD